MEQVKENYSERKEYLELMTFLPKVVRLLNEITIAEVSGEEERKNEPDKKT